MTEPLDRAAHHRTDPQWLADAWPRARVIVVDSPDLISGRALVRGPVAVFGRPQPDLPRGVTQLVLFDASDPEVRDSDPDDRFFLGVDEDGTPYFAVNAALPEVDGAQPATLREVG
ncbi:MAG TPA: hypothetical protein VE132_05500, partial [Micromonosporaceae bacterium]|nr:hypothetical protein [Micromonosporaceae bacterium]